MTRNNLVNRTKLNMAGLGSSFGSTRSIKGCVSTRIAGGKNFLLSERNSFYNLPVFPAYLKLICNDDQLGILNFFEAFPYIKKREQYIFDSNTLYSLIELDQTHFVNGTVRITKPGIYVLTENIVFNPNENDDFFPRMDQLSKYPMGNSGPFHLGFFSAITIESDNVILDLNGKTIIQSQLHNIEQRFYAHIELASSPFIPNQGPGNFGETIKVPKNVCIMNGTLGLSSHHGIHGNKMENVIVNNVVFKDFEVAAVALNGGNNCILNNLSVLNTNMNVKVLSTYSSARFIRKFLRNIENIDNQRSLNLNSGVKTITNIISELESEMLKIKNEEKNNLSLPDSIFTNPLDGYDANVYGIVFNRKGVVVNDFITELGDVTTGNRNNIIANVSIKNIRSTPLEIIGISCPDPATGAYGKGVQETRYLLTLIPIVALFSGYGINWIYSKIGKNVLLIIIPIVISSGLFLIITENDRNELEYFEDARNIIKFANGINNYEGSTFLKVAEMEERWPDLVPYGENRKILLDIKKFSSDEHENVEDLIIKNYEKGLTHLVIYQKNNSGYLDQIFANEEKFSYLEKVFESKTRLETNSMKIFYINYAMFDKIINDKE